MQYRPPLAKVISSERDGDVVVTVLDQKRPPPDPIAPGALYEAENSSAEVFPLHKLTARESGREIDRLTFETYGTTGSLPKQGAQHELRSWWLPHAMDALLDPDAGWERARYEGDRRDDEMCLFTWENLADYPDAYRSKYGWATAEAFDLYVRHDLLRMREGLQHQDAV